MKFFGKFSHRFWDWFGGSEAAGRVFVLAFAALCGLLYAGGLILDKLLGRTAAPWPSVIGVGLGIGTLLALWFIEEDLADPEPVFGFKRRDQYLCGAVGGLVCALLIGFGWRQALVGALIGLLVAALIRWLKYVMRYV
ncbi:MULTISPECIES: hypothetical protein [Eikenella]|uniref:Uncharacterized protein n=1 Tax=Eikenella longinqua TaxID=1795827 RepID=A0A1A9RXG5_9NEIS|nr:MULTISPECIES: hypothetical protein [Eikenella]OAM27136.1 hypothetical protein A7P95_07030 [Eikenella longinqua]